MIVLPVVAGVLLGRVLDRALGTGSTLTLVLLATGIGIAIMEGWRAAATALKLIRHD
jgi:hypothetical protein